MDKKLKILAFIVFLLIILSGYYFYNKFMVNHVVSDISEIDFLPKCGNNACESGENEFTCCNDCGCGSVNMICKPEIKRCIFKETGISEEEAIEIYFSNVSYVNDTLIYEEGTRIFDAEFNGELALTVCVPVQKIKNITVEHCILINKNREIIRQYATNR